MPCDAKPCATQIAPSGFHGAVPDLCDAESHGPWSVHKSVQAGFVYPDLVEIYAKICQSSPQDDQSFQSPCFLELLLQTGPGIL